MRCNKKLVSRESPVTDEIRFPASLMKAKACEFQQPDDSTAIGTNMCERIKSAYLVFLSMAALSAAAPACWAVESIYDVAKVSEIVTSQTRPRPLDHGTIVAPSGRLPSDLVNPTGSFTD